MAAWPTDRFPVYPHTARKLKYAYAVDHIVGYEGIYAIEARRLRKVGAQRPPREFSFDLLFQVVGVVFLLLLGLVTALVALCALASRPLARLDGLVAEHEELAGLQVGEGGAG